MTVRILTANVSTTPVHIADRISGIISGKIRLAMKIKHLVEDKDWEEEILAGEKWVNSFCWSLLGFSALFFTFICFSMLSRQTG
jgi:hypothetical protein